MLIEEIIQKIEQKMAGFAGIRSGFLQMSSRLIPHFFPAWVGKWVRFFAVWVKEWVKPPDARRQSKRKDRFRNCGQGVGSQFLEFRVSVKKWVRAIFHTRIRLVFRTEKWVLEDREVFGELTFSDLPATKDACQNLRR